MIIGVDAGCLGIKDDRLKVGVYQVAVNLFRELAKIDTQNTYYLYSFSKIDKKLLQEFGPNVKNIVVKPVRGWTKIWLPLQLLKDKPDVFLGLNQSLPLKLPLQTYKSIVVVYDLLFESQKKMYVGSYRKLHKESKTAVENADAVIAISEATKRDLEKIYKVQAEKIVVAYPGKREFPAPNKLLSKKPYFLFVGALKPQKNVPLLLRSFAQIQNPHPRLLPAKQGEGDQGIELYIVGGDKWKDVKIGKALQEMSENVLQRVRFFGNVNDEELATLYKNAHAFVSPSISEGFGLPFLEALSFGIPVIGTKFGAVPEVVGNAGILVDPLNPSEITQAMEKMMDEKVYWQYKKETLDQADKFSWEEFARKIIATFYSQ